MNEYPRKCFESYQVFYFLELFPHPKFSLFYFMLYVFKLLQTNKQRKGGYYNSCSQMFSLASDARPQLQAYVPEAQAENQNVVGRLEI